jgi:hypothetical protein
MNLRLIGQKPPLKLWEIWTVRAQLRMAGKIRDLALFNLAIDSKLRGCDRVALRVGDVAHGEHVLSRASVVQHTTGVPIRFELTAASPALACLGAGLSRHAEAYAMSGAKHWTLAMWFNIRPVHSIRSRILARARFSNP